MIAFCNRYSVHPETLLVFLCVLALSFTFALPVWAQSIDGQPFSVDFTPLASNVLNAVVVVLTVLAGVVSKFAVSWLASKTKMNDTEFEALAAARVHDILLKSIDYAEMYAKRELADPTSGLKNVKIDNFFVRMAAEYAQKSMPDLISLFKLTPERIEEMIRSRLNSVTRTPSPDSGAVEMVVQ